MTSAPREGMASDPRVAALAKSAEPAWLWTIDAHRVLWANAAGAAAFGAPSPEALAGRQFGRGEPAAAQVARIAGLLADGATRNEVLRWFGSDPQRVFACSCTRLTLEDGTAAILIAVEPRHATPLSPATPAIPDPDEPRAPISEPAQAEPAAAPAPAPLALVPQPAEFDTTTVATLPLAGAPAETAPIAGSPTIDITPVPAGGEDAAPGAGRHPLRFVWQVDAEGRFTLDSDEFLQLIGPRAASALGRPWQEFSMALGLDPDMLVASAMAARSTWSGIVVSWPTVEADLRLTVELAGLPVYDRQRRYAGYRGFGVCRDFTGMARLQQSRGAGAEVATPLPGDEASPEAHPTRPAAVASAASPAAPNVLPFRAQGEPRSPVLSPVERKTFSDLAQQLSARLKSADAVLESEASGPDGAPPARAPADESAADDASMPAWAAAGSEGRALLDRLPIGLLVYRLDTLLYANRAFLERTGHPTVESFQDAGGLEALFIETGSPDTGVGQSLTITTSKGETTPTEGRLLSLQWNGENALALMLLAPQVAPPASAPATAPPNALTREVGELKEQLQRMQVRLTEAGQQSQPSAARAELLARIGVDMRTPLNTVVGLVETMLEEKFGPIGNERYRGYLSDIGKSGDRIAALVGDIDDLAKAGDDKLGEGFITLNLNDIVQSCVSAAQPQASVARVLVRNSLAPELPTIRADAAILRQVVQNLLANSIKLAGKGGQVIVSTAPATERVVLRLRDTGPGMTETELAAALQPARSPVAAPDAAAALTLAVTKTLAEANNAQFIVISKPGEGTLIEISFPQRPPAA